MHNSHSGASVRCVGSERPVFGCVHVTGLPLLNLSWAYCFLLTVTASCSWGSRFRNICSCRVGCRVDCWVGCRVGISRQRHLWFLGSIGGSFYILYKPTVSEINACSPICSFCQINLPLGLSFTLLKKTYEMKKGLWNKMAVFVVLALIALMPLVWTWGYTSPSREINCVLSTSRSVIPVLLGERHLALETHVN